MLPPFSKGSGHFPILLS